MFAMLLDKPGARLRPADIELPPLASDQLLIRVHACGVCRPDLHVSAGEEPALVALETHAPAAP